MRTFFILLFTGLLSFASAVNTQRNPYPIFTDREMPMPFLDDGGKTLFELPAGDRPIWLQHGSKSAMLMMVGYPQPMNVFFENICVVRAKDGSFYWINTSGEKIRDFGMEYWHIGPISEGFAVARKKIEGTNSSEIIYLDKDGNKAFEGQTFWEGGEFSEGLAAIQKEDGGEWGFIDKEANIQIQLSGKENKGTLIEVRPFSEGLAQLIFRIPGTYQNNAVFIDKTGKEVFDIAELFPGRKLKTAGKFQEGLVDITLMRSGTGFYDLAYLDPNGNAKQKYGIVNRHSPFINGKAFYAQGIKEEGGYQVKDYILFKNGKKTLLDNPDGMTINTVRRLNQTYIEAVATQADRTEKKLLLHASNFKPVLITDLNIVGFTHDRFLLVNSKTKQFTFQTSQGLFLWGTPVSDTKFLSIEQALKYKKQVLNYEMMDGNDFQNGFFELENLEILRIRKARITELPSQISSLNQLRILTLDDLPNLKGLPVEMAKIPQLKRLEITDCKNFSQISELERIIESAPALKSVYLLDIELTDGFEERMKAERPDLKLEAEYTLQETQIMELDDFRNE